MTHTHTYIYNVYTPIYWTLWFTGQVILHSMSICIRLTTSIISFVDLHVSESSPLLYSPRSIPQHGHCHPGHPRINTTSHHRVLALYNSTQNLDVDLLPKVIKISDCMSVDGPTIRMLSVVGKTELRVFNYRTPNWTGLPFMCFGNKYNSVCYVKNCNWTHIFSNYLYELIDHAVGN